MKGGKCFNELISSGDKAGGVINVFRYVVFIALHFPYIADRHRFLPLLAAVRRV